MKTSLITTKIAGHAQKSKKNTKGMEIELLSAFCQYITLIAYVLYTSVSKNSTCLAGTNVEIACL